VYESHHRHLFEVLKRYGIEYDVYMHTWITETNFIWEEDCSVPIDYDEYQLLKPTFFQRDRQDVFLESLTFSDYFNHDLYAQYGGDTLHEWRPQLLRNHLCALESQKRVYEMCQQPYDFIMFLRPDVMLTNDFDVKGFETPFDILIPNYEHFEGYNDKFAVLPFNKAKPYATRIDEIIDFRKHHGRIVSEKYVKYIIDKYYTVVVFIAFTMYLVRP